jgi:hypothetical protein
MILILNGSFGVGKTTVGRLLRRRIAGSRLYNPEWTGSILMRLPSLIKPEGSGTDDFQDIDLWRKSVVRGTRLFRAFARETVIVPMAFSRRDYFDEIVGGMREFDNRVKVFCLQAGLATILNRLRRRGEKIEGGDEDWVVRKARECIEAQSDAHFGEPVNTEDLSAVEVADEILKRLAATNESPKNNR